MYRTFFYILKIYNVSTNYLPAKLWIYNKKQNNLERYNIFAVDISYTYNLFTNGCIY